MPALLPAVFSAVNALTTTLAGVSFDVLALPQS